MKATPKKAIKGIAAARMKQQGTAAMANTKRGVPSGKASGITQGSPNPAFDNDADDSMAGKLMPAVAAKHGAGNGFVPPGVSGAFPRGAGVGLKRKALR